MKQSNTRGNEISRNLPHLKILQRVNPKDKPRKDAQEFKPRLRDELASLAAVTVLFGVLIYAAPIIEIMREGVK